MALETDLLRCVDAYCAARGIARATLSTTLVNDGKTLDRLVSGGSLTVRKWQHCMDWLSENWPPGARWPADVPRPKQARAQAARNSQPKIVAKTRAPQRRRRRA